MYIFKPIISNVVTILDHASRVLFLESKSRLELYLLFPKTPNIIQSSFTSNILGIQLNLPSIRTYTRTTTYGGTIDAAFNTMTITESVLGNTHHPIQKLLINHIVTSHICSNSSYFFPCPPITLRPTLDAMDFMHRCTNPRHA